jgi:hypothetical protein
MSVSEYLSAGKKALVQWAPQLEARLGRYSERFLKDASPSSPDSSQRAIERMVDHPPSLDEILQSHHEFFIPSLLLGVGEDGAPFQMDLRNPASGALLICGDEKAETSFLLRGIIASAVLINPAEEFAISILTKRLDEFLDFSSYAHCQEIIPSNEELASELILELADIAEHRRNGEPIGATLMLIIDDLVECVSYLSETAYHRLYWLIRHGPRYCIWTIATLPVERYNEIEARYLTAFRTRLFGHIQYRNVIAQLSGETNLFCNQLKPGQFFLPFNGEWLRFWACDANRLNSE